MALYDYRDYRGMFVDAEWLEDFLDDNEIDEQSIVNFLGEDSSKDGVFIDFVTSLPDLKDFITSDKLTFTITRIREAVNV